MLKNWRNVCVFVCKCVYVRVCVFLRARARAHACVYVWTFVRVCLWVSACARAYVFVVKCARVRVCACTFRKTQYCFFFGWLTTKPSAICHNGGISLVSTNVFSMNPIYLFVLYSHIFHYMYQQIRMIKTSNKNPKKRDGKKKTNHLII